MTKELTFNDLPQVVMQLVDKVTGLTNEITELRTSMQGASASGKSDAHRPIEMWREAVLSLTTQYEAAPEILSVGGVPIGTLGNFSASIGKAKSKKTFNVSAMVAAALTDEPVMGYQVSLPADKDKDFAKDYTNEQHRQTLELAFPTDEPIKGYENVRKALVDAYYALDIELNQPKSMQLMTFLGNKRMIHQDKGRGIYTYDPTFKW